MAKLIFRGEKFSGRVYEFAMEKTSVGRGDHNTLTIHDPSVSHSHCEILVNGTEVIVRDLGSSNGTFVNDVRLHDQQRPLLAGQTVKFGSVEARLELESPDTSDTVTDMTAIFSHARHLPDPQKKAKPAGSAAVTLGADTPTRPKDHTLVLPPPSEKQATTPPGEMKEDTEKPIGKIALVTIVAALVIGLTILCWLILIRNR